MGTPAYTKIIFNKIEKGVQLTAVVEFIEFYHQSLYKYKIRDKRDAGNNRGVSFLPWTTHLFDTIILEHMSRIHTLSL